MKKKMMSAIFILLVSGLISSEVKAGKLVDTIYLYPSETIDRCRAKFVGLADTKSDYSNQSLGEYVYIDGEFTQNNVESDYVEDSGDNYDKVYPGNVDAYNYEIASRDTSDQCITKLNKYRSCAELFCDGGTSSVMFESWNNESKNKELTFEEQISIPGDIIQYDDQMNTFYYVDAKGKWDVGKCDTKGHRKGRDGHCELRSQLYTSNLEDDVDGAIYEIIELTGAVIMDVWLD